MKIGILGAGSIGCYLGGKLIAAGHDVVMIGRWGKEIAAHGLRLTDYEGGDLFLESARIRYFAKPQALAGVEAVLVTVKSAATEEAARPLGSLLPWAAAIVSFQNGVSNTPRLRALLPHHTVLAGIVPFNVAHKGPGEFHKGTSGPLTMEKRVGSQAIAGALRNAGFAVELHDHLEGLQWTKLLMNLNNSVNALAGIPLREQLGDRTYRRVMAMCVREGLAVLRAARIRPVRVGKLIPSLAPFVLSLPDSLFFRVAGTMIQIDPMARSSMLDDLDRRHATEVDYLNGELIALADQYGVAVPVNRKMLELVKAAESAAVGSPRITSQDLLVRVSA